MRIERRPSDGRKRVRVRENGRERYVYLYRLSAVAWGILDGLSDDRVIHHLNGDPTDDRRENLRAVEPGDHPRDGNGWNT